MSQTSPLAEMPAPSNATQRRSAARVGSAQALVALAVKPGPILGS